MNLVLGVIGKMAGNVGLQQEKSWSENGGTIGRAKDNDWVLPDPDRFVSGKHAQISYQNGVFYITDTSVNGVYINGAAEPLGSGNMAELKAGDNIAIGDYLIEVTIKQGDACAEFNSEPGFDGYKVSPGIARVEPMPAVEGAGEDPLDLLLGDDKDDSLVMKDSFMLTQPTQPGQIGGASQKPMDSFFEPPEVKAEPMTDELALKKETPGAHSSFGIPEDWDVEEVSETRPSPDELFAEIPRADSLPDIEPLLDEKPVVDNHFESKPVYEPRPAQVEPPLPQNQKAEVRQQQYPENFKAMEFGSEEVESLVAEQWLSMLPDILEGMMSSMRSRAEIKNEMRVDKTMLATAENNPLKFSVSAQSAANNLFVDKSGSFLSPEQAFSEAFRDIQVHQIALMTAMQHTIREMMERFNPKKLEQRFEKGMRRKPLFGGSNKSAYWDLYTERYNELCSDSDKLFQELVSNVFAEAYEKAAREAIRGSLR